MISSPVMYVYILFSQLVMGTMEDLQKLYPEIKPNNRLLEIKGTSTDQVHLFTPPIGLKYLTGCIMSNTEY